MIVYRVCKKDEFECLVNGIAFDGLGTYFDFDTSKLNSHEYVEHRNYLHFFKDIASVTFLGELKDNYLCYYDIPEDILEQYRGIGYYNEPGLIYRKFDLIEYAIPSELIKYEYLIGIDKIKIEIEMDDYFDDPSLHEYVEMVYYQGDDKKLVKL